MGTNETTCPYCGMTTKKKALTTPNVHFKGKGFYETDYKRKDSKGE
jgi:predicted nucleic acid-binding Zn ribbon protein